MLTLSTPCFVTAAAHRLAGVHGAIIGGAVVLAILVGVVWNAWRRAR